MLPPGFALDAGRGRRQPGGRAAATRGMAWQAGSCGRAADRGQPIAHLLKNAGQTGNGRNSGKPEGLAADCGAARARARCARASGNLLGRPPTVRAPGGARTAGRCFRGHPLGGANVPGSARVPSRPGAGGAGAAVFRGSSRIARSTAGMAGRQAERAKAQPGPVVGSRDRPANSAVAARGPAGRHGWAGAALDRMAGLHTDVAEVGGEDWAKRARLGFSGRTTAGRDGLRRTLPRP
jgi:hypothetical protein